MIILPSSVLTTSQSLLAYLKNTFASLSYEHSNGFTLFSVEYQCSKIVLDRLRRMAGTVSKVRVFYFCNRENTAARGLICHFYARRKVQITVKTSRINLMRLRHLLMLS